MSTATQPPVASEPSAPANVYVSRIVAAEDFPAFAKVMSDLMSSLRDDDASAQRLANLVLRDYALTVKVIRTANTVHYNRSGRTVQSATHALMLLGARTVRDLASGLLLFEQYRRRSPGLKELMLLSLLTGSHAREAAMRRGGADPETAQLCGMFRNLGEVLVAAHLPAEYAEVLRRTPEFRAGPDGILVPGGASRARGQAAMAVLGCSFEDIGVAIATRWGMPDVVRRGMRATGAPGEDATELATAFGYDLATAIYREDADAARDGVGRVLHLYGKRLDLTRESLAAVADAAVGETKDVFASARVALDDLRLGRQIARALMETPAADEAAGAEKTDEAPSAPAPLAATPPSATPAVGAEDTHHPPVGGPALAALRERLASDVASAVADVGAYETQRALLVALEAVLRGGPFDRAAFCAVDVRLGELRARFGLGDGVERLVETVALPLAGGTTSIGPVLLRGEQVMLSLGMRASLQEAQLLRSWGAACAALLPVTVDGTTIGAVYVDRRSSATGFDAPTLSYLRRVVASTSHALALRRTRPATTAAPALVSPAVAAHMPVTAAERADMVLRVLRGETIQSVAEERDVTVAELSRWKDEFLAAAVARLSSV
jgi:HD-like signal output (HDOD) protein